MAAQRVQLATQLATEQRPHIPVMAYATAYFSGGKYLRLMNATEVRQLLEVA